MHPTFSPDGHWLAYASDQSGQWEVYVTSYPGAGSKYQISNEGGRSPTWAQNGRELFYRSPPDSEGLRSMMAVDITTEPTFSLGRPRELFKERYYGTIPLRSYDVTPDGRHYLMIQENAPQREPVTQTNVVLNWFDELKRLAPTEN